LWHGLNIKKLKADALFASNLNHGPNRNGYQNPAETAAGKGAAGVFNRRMPAENYAID
jgi:hypothetical protein